MFTKPINDITFGDIKSFCKEWSEGVRVEYKQKIVHVPKIVSSFANTYGGLYLIGIEVDRTTNMPIFPIKGIPKSQGIEEQIQQSAEMSINPPVRPEVKVVNIPNSSNVVVVIRVAEGSLLAPHAIEHSTKAYFRVGSTTQPYTLELANMELIAHMFKRREDSQIVAGQIINRIEERVERVGFDLALPNITVIIRPVFPYRPVIPPSDIYQLFPRLYQLRRVTGGVCSILVDAVEYTELNEYGIVYHKAVLCPAGVHGIEYGDFLNGIRKVIQRASELYKECEYSGNIEVSVRLKQIYGTELLAGQRRFMYQENSTRSLDSEIFVSKQCFPRDLSDRKERRNIVEDLILQLLWAFDVPNDASNIKKMIRERIE